MLHRSWFDQTSQPHSIAPHSPARSRRRTCAEDGALVPQRMEANTTTSSQRRAGGRPPRARWWARDSVVPVHFASRSRRRDLRRRRVLQHHQPQLPPRDRQANPTVAAGGLGGEGLWHPAICPTKYLTTVEGVLIMSTNAKRLGGRTNARLRPKRTSTRRPSRKLDFPNEMKGGATAVCRQSTRPMSARSLGAPTFTATWPESKEPALAESRRALPFPYPREHAPEHGRISHEEQTASRNASSV